MTFAQLGLDQALLNALTAAGYQTPTAVQAQTIPAALEGHDLLVSSHTGSGKTAAFLLPGLQRLLEPSAAAGNGPRMLVLTPTRELALQVEKAARTYGQHMRRLRTACLVGGSPYGLQLKALSQPVDIVIATPGRLMDHMERGRIDFARLQTLVLDEADRMLDMGFIDDIEAIVRATPATRQTLLFSATLDGVVGNLARRLTKNPKRIEIATTDGARANIEQRLMFADNAHHKSRLLDHLLRDAALGQAVVFVATKRGAEELADRLRDQGFASAALHGDMQQRERNRTLDHLRRGTTQILVATDVAARGIDVAGISHVINFEPPRQAEDYVHRIGRTGRAGRSGVAITLAAPEERRMIREIERFTGARLAVSAIPGLEPKPHTERSGGPRPGARGTPRSRNGGREAARRQGFDARPAYASEARPKPQGRRDWDAVGNRAQPLERARSGGSARRLTGSGPMPADARDSRGYGRNAHSTRSHPRAAARRGR
ncbi:DEAD/DEAH box helicase [Thiobacter aerophilum]|uniref:DEAD/DEAH box helicase n=1 Tax=Thiobacter aerophilum TaxID=3121275 RepID=A0ABV0EEC3_9BURK